MAPSAYADPAPLESAHKEKRFFCSEQGCGKSFARREHLHRHAFNHKDADFTCPRCAAHFRRRDLLERHAQRHRQKDAEAGGEGLGNLATRKRLWRDSEGRVVNASRPHKIASSTSGLDGTGARQDDIILDDTGVRHGDIMLDGLNCGLPSRITSNPSIGSDETSNNQAMDLTYLQDGWPPVDMSFMPQSEGTDLDFLSDASWANQSFQTLIEAPCDLPDNDVTFTDTTISFSTQLPTLQYYSWLFGNDIANADINHSQPPPSKTSTHELVHDRTLDRFPAASFDPTLHSAPPPLHSGLGDSSTALKLHPQSQSRNLNTGLQSPDSSPGQTIRKSSADRQSPFSAGTINCVSSPSYQGSASELGIIGLDSPHLYFSSNQKPTIVAHAGSSYIYTDDLPPPDSFVRETPPKLPIITNEARDGLMQLISQTRPTRPDKSEISSCDPLLSLASLQHYGDLFFTHFNTTYPLIHPATFQSSTVHSLLLMSIVLLGATYSDKKAHMLAVCIHDIMRPLIHSSREFGTRPSLWMLQTILLVECFGKSRAGERQHDMSNVYHGLQINLLRRSDCHNVHIPPWDETTQTLEEYWHMAIEAEQKRRLALISFMWDTQHAIFFAQILCLNASELKVALPWDTAIWEADTAEDWLYLTKTSPASPQYLTILQMYTDPSVSSAPSHLNALSRVLVFHGLMSLSWDFRRRDQTALNRNTTSTGVRWQTKVSNCYTKWKEDFDRYTKDVLSSLSTSPTQHAKFQRSSVASSAVYHTAQLILEVETADLQIHAGAKHIIGRPVKDLDRQRSRTRLDEFMTRDEGKSIGRATWHAARLLRDGIRKLDNWDVEEMIHFPWCLYLATLTCWTTYSLATENCTDELQTSLYAPPPDYDVVDEEGDWDSRTDMMALISALTRLDPARRTFAKDIWRVAGQSRPHGLLTCMVKHLSTVRWAVVREGMIVLNDLMGTTRVSDSRHS